MCRSIVEGGRRCAAHDTASQSRSRAQRRARARLRSEAYARMGAAKSIFDIALTGDERAREIELHDKWLASLRADGSNPEIAQMRFDRLHGNAVTLDDPARAWLTEAYACGAAYGDLNERAVREAFEDENPSPLARAAFAQAYDQVRRGQDTSVAPLDRLRALPDQAVEDALAASNALGGEYTREDSAYRARLAAAREDAAADLNDANAEVTAAAGEVQKLKRGFARVTPSGAPATWSDADRTRYDAHVEKLRGAEERETAGRERVKAVEDAVAASADRTRLDAVLRDSARVSEQMNAAIAAARVRTRELAVYSALPVRTDMLPTLERTVAGTPFTTTDLTRLSEWAEGSMHDRGWDEGGGVGTTLVETRKDVTLSMVRMNDGWGLVGLSRDVTPESNVAANLRRNTDGI